MRTLTDVMVATVAVVCGGKKKNSRIHETSGRFGLAYRRWRLGYQVDSEPPSLCWWNASKGICRSSARNNHSRTRRSFNPSVFPGGGGAMAVVPCQLPLAPQLLSEPRFLTSHPQLQAESDITQPSLLRTLLTKAQA